MKIRCKTAPISFAWRTSPRRRFVFTHRGIEDMLDKDVRLLQKKLGVNFDYHFEILQEVKHGSKRNNKR